MMGNQPERSGALKILGAVLAKPDAVRILSNLQTQPDGERIIPREMVDRALDLARPDSSTGVRLSMTQDASMTILCVLMRTLNASWDALIAEPLPFGNQDLEDLATHANAVHELATAMGMVALHREVTATRL